MVKLKLAVCKNIASFLVKKLKQSITKSRFK